MVRRAEFSLGKAIRAGQEAGTVGGTIGRPKAVPDKDDFSRPSPRDHFSGSQEIQIDAQEMVRRSEFALGKAIRAGQEAGEVGNATTGGKVRQRILDQNSLTSPKSLIPNGQELHDTYAMSDGVTEEDFEAALAEARAET